MNDSEIARREEKYVGRVRLKTKLKLHDNLIKNGPIDMHALKRFTRLQRIGLQPLHLLYDQRVFSRSCTRREPFSLSCDVPIRERSNTKRVQDLLFDETLQNQVNSIRVNRESITVTHT